MFGEFLDAVVQVLVVSNSLALLGFTYLRQGQHPREENLQAYILVGGLATWLVNLLVFGECTKTLTAISIKRWPEVLNVSLAIAKQ